MPSLSSETCHQHHSGVISDILICFKCCTVPHSTLGSEVGATRPLDPLEAEVTILSTTRVSKFNVKTASLCADLQRFNPV